MHRLLHTRFFSIALCAAAGACIAERGPFTNRMAHSGTSYLSRAARQPVNWQPWGRDAFTLAAKLDRPILLYVGGDDCRWCMETDRAIYTDPEIAALINALFVPVRVDRDERPDVAQRYQSAVERLASLHGWPLTVFLTADGSPFFGGTYFPADDPITGRGLKQILPEVAKRYRDQRSFLVQQAALVRQLMLTGGGESRGVLRSRVISDGVDAIKRDLDAATHAGTVAGSVTAAAAASLLLTESARYRDTIALAVSRRALDVMIDTSLGGAGEDPPRLVRAALVGALAKAWVVTGDSRYQNAGRALVRGLARDLPNAEFADRQAYVIEQLMLAAATLDEPSIETRARGALDALLQQAYARGWGVRHALAGMSSLGLLQDQVQVASACVGAYQLTHEPRYLEVARDIAAIMDRDYADSLGGYYDTPAASAGSAGGAGGTGGTLPVLSERTKQALDDVLPGANPAAAGMLARLAAATGDASYRRRAQATLEAFAGGIAGAGLRATTFLAAAREVVGTP